MGFFNNIWTGATDIAGGVGGFVADVARAGQDLSQGHVSEASSVLFTSVQDDLMGNVLQGAFGPDGIVGSLVGELPEGIRQPGRAVLVPTMDAWKWTIDEVVDRPLGTIATVLNATAANGVHELFDVGTYVDAYRVNDARTFGQSAAAMLWNINPFDEEEYNSIRDSPLFNLFSGTLDFVQEFIDPVQFASAGVVGLAKGKLIIGGVARDGAAIERATRVLGGGAGIRPATMLGRSWGPLTKNAEQLASVSEQIAKHTTIRTDRFLASAKWAHVSEAMDAATAAGRGYKGRFEVLNATLGRSGANLPRQAKEAIARGQTAAARDMMVRTLTGDMTQLAKAEQAGTRLVDLYASSGMSEWVDEYHTLLNASNAGKLKDPAKIARFDELSVKMKPFNDAYESVDWVSMFDMKRAVVRAQQRKVISEKFGYGIDGNFDITLNSGGDYAMLTAAVDEIIGRAGETTSPFFDFGPDVADVSSLVRPVVGSGLGGRLPYGRGLKRLQERSRNYLEKTGRDVVSHEYVNPKTVAGDRRTLRLFFEKTPQTRIDFHDAGSRYDMFERMLSQASRVKVGGERLIDAQQVGEHLARFAELESHGHYASMATHFDTVTEGLIKRFDELSPESYSSLWDQYKHADNVWQTANERARALSVTNDGAGALASSEADMGAGMVHVDLGDEIVSLPGPKPGPELTAETAAVGSQMSPSQLHTTRVNPRWDLIEHELRKVERRGSTGARKVVSDLQDTVGEGARVANAGATALMSVWRPAVLLTPKWPMRVGLDEQLRIASDLGGIETLRMFARSLPDLSRTLAAKSMLRKGRSLGASTDLTHIVSRVDELAAAHGVTVAENATLWDRLQALETKLGTKQAEKELRDVYRNLTNEALEESRRYRAAVAGIKGLAVGTVLSGPAGLIYSGISFAARRRRLLQVTERNAALTMADALVGEGRRLLAEAVNDPKLAAEAELLVRRGESIAEYVTDASKSVLPEQAAGMLDKADRLLDQAGLPMLHVGNVRVRGAFGDDLRHIGKTKKYVSSTQSMEHLYRGARNRAMDEVSQFAKHDWKAWDVLTDGGKHEQNFAVMMNLYTSAGEFPEFYKLVWGNGDAAARAEELAAMLRKDPNLRAHMGFTRASDTQLREIADAVINEYDNVLPPDRFGALRERAAAGRQVQWNEVEAVLMKEAEDAGFSLEDAIRLVRSDNAPDFGKAIAPDVSSPNPGNGRVGLGKWLDSKVESLFETLGSQVSDNMARNPYFQAKYEKEVTRRMTAYIDQVGEAKVSQVAINQIEAEARAASLKEVRTLLYDLAEDTRFGEMATNIMPFYNAWGEVISRWAGMAAANPYYVANVARIYNRPWNAETLGITEVTDEESGAKFLMFRWHNPTQDTPGHEKRTVFDVMSPAVRDLLIPKVMRDPNRTIRMSKDGLASMMQQTTPGFGPLVTVPVREAILARPTLEETFGFMFPFGHPEGGFFDRAVKDLSPTWMKSVDDLMRDSPTNERMVQSMFLDYAVQRQEAGDPIDAGDLADVNASIKVANDRAQTFHMFRVAAGLFSPVSTTAMSPYDPLLKIARGYQHKYGTKEGNARFLAEYGDDLFALTARMTQLNDGVGASVDSEKAFMANQDLVQAHPEVGAWITGSVGATDEVFKFSQAAYRRQRNMAVSPSDSRRRRERKTPMETIAGPRRELGWREYSLLSDAVRSEQAKRKAAGLPYNLNAESMQQIAQYKREQMRILRDKYPEWAQQFDDYGASDRRMKAIVDGFLAGLRNENMLARPSTKHVIQYFQLRQAVQDELLRRQANGGSANLSEAASNQDLWLYFEEQRAELADRPDFSDIYDRFLARDTLSEKTFVDPGQFNLGFVRF